MPLFRVLGTSKTYPTKTDWYQILETSDPVEATAAVHETEGTFWRRLIEDDHVVLDRV
ncbi:hypothetical protein [Streptomyces sp. DH12]|uniref:hypothetical protein n=1 Tax=Streptomyces sp. DH12 TaxID=2857010 RepID=UPI001E38BDC8|nr:hypothetical protein [Streptomyces sp. DH12]